MTLDRIGRGASDERTKKAMIQQGSDLKRSDAPIADT